MADRWERGPRALRAWRLVRNGTLLVGGVVQDSAAGVWVGWVHNGNANLPRTFPTRKAAMRAVMVEAASNKRCGAAG